MLQFCRGSEAFECVQNIVNIEINHPLNYVHCVSKNNSVLSKSNCFKSNSNIVNSEDKARKLITYYADANEKFKQNAKEAKLKREAKKKWLEENTIPTFSDSGKTKVIKINGYGSNICGVGPAYGAGCARGIIGQWVADKEYAKKDARESASETCKELKLKSTNILHSETVAEPKISKSGCGKLVCLAHTGCQYKCEAFSKVNCKIEVRK